MTANAARSWASSVICRRDDHTPVRVVAFGASTDSFDFAERVVDDLSVGGRHRLQHASNATLLHFVCHLQREPVEGLLAALAIATDVDTQASVVIAEPPLRRDPSQILHGLQRRATRPDEQAEILAVNADLEIV